MQGYNQAIQRQNYVFQNFWTLDSTFKSKLALSQGTNPIYHAYLRPMIPFGPPQTYFPVNAVPDGYLMYGEGIFSEEGLPNEPQMSGGITIFSFQDAHADHHLPQYHDWTYVRYGGKFYRRMWIRESDRHWVLKGQAVYLFPSPRIPEDVSLPRMPAQEKMIPLTLAEGSYRPIIGYDFLLLRQGKPQTLDKHAWESEPVPQQPRVPDAVMTREFCRQGLDVSSEVSPLDSTPNDTPMSCSMYTLRRAAHPAWKGLMSARPDLVNIPLSPIAVDSRPEVHKSWSIIKHNSVVYLRGWVAANLVHKIAEGQQLDVYNTSDAPELKQGAVRITIRPKTLSFDDLYGFNRCRLSNIFLDTRLGEVVKQEAVAVNVSAGTSCPPRQRHIRGNSTMPQHEPSPVEQPALTADNRVTPEEMAKALAAIETRKDQSAREAAGTISIGEAVQQLGFDSASAKDAAASLASSRRGCFGFGSFRHDVFHPNRQTECHLRRRSDQRVRPNVHLATRAVDRDRDAGRGQEQRDVLLRPGDGGSAAHGQGACAVPSSRHGGATVHRTAEGDIPIYASGLDDTGGASDTQPITLRVGGFKLSGPGSENVEGIQSLTVSNVHHDAHLADNW